MGTLHIIKLLAFGAVTNTAADGQHLASGRVIAWGDVCDTYSHPIGLFLPVQVRRQHGSLPGTIQPCTCHIVKPGVIIRNHEMLLQRHHHRCPVFRGPRDRHGTRMEPQELPVIVLHHGLQFHCIAGRLSSVKRRETNHGGEQNFGRHGDEMNQMAFSAGTTNGARYSRASRALAVALSRNSSLPPSTRRC